MDVAVKEKIKVRDALKRYITPLTGDEFNQLEANILEEGCRDPLIVWKNGNEFILLDGHNRYRICKKHHIHFEVEEKSFNDEETARLWMINNQLGRRNLNAYQLSYYRGLKYLEEKKQKEGMNM